MKNVNDKEYHTLVKAERLYLNAARKAGNAVLARKMEEYLEEDEEDQELRYRKKSYYDQFTTLAKQWAYNPKTQKGDTNFFYNAQDNTWYLLIAEDSDVGYRVEKVVKKDKDGVKHESNSREQRNGREFHEHIDRYWIGRRGGRNSTYDGHFGTNGQNGRIHRGQSESGQERISEQSGRDHSKIIGFQSNEDGSVTYRYSDGTKIRYSKKTAKYIP